MDRRDAGPTHSFTTSQVALLDGSDFALIDLFSVFDENFSGVLVA